ncbi:hypothetical protein NP493_126g00024 [Ridgeia piscesae]|uniref:N-alpha-acetyltransferase 40 n=1 Tax=Ridgeia piscesae TaxID=27915 RepID=A0AAD9UGI0_RIDPI|nr:hypothetical protein NP493_126g00024 [Ridgeia piscesae]
MSLLVPFKKFQRNGLDLTICCHRVEDLDAETKDWTFKLTKSNMQGFYEDSGWGWNDKQKLDEMSEDKARYLVARNQENKPVALVHFRFDMDYEEAVLYCYEIQLVKSVRHKALGKFLMQILELLAHKTQMSKVMLTVFKQNQAALEFFTKKLKYDMDETSPEDSMAEAMFDEDGFNTYIILRKMIGVSRKDVSQHSHGHCPHGCSH